MGMEVVIREIRIRDQVEYVVDANDGLVPETKLRIILEALYNTLLTDSKLVSKSYDREKIIFLREVVESFMKTADEDVDKAEKERRFLALRDAIGLYLAS